MRLVIAAVGRSRASPGADAVSKIMSQRAEAMGPRLGFAKVEAAIVDTSRAATAEARMSDEADAACSQDPQGRLRDRAR